VIFGLETCFEKQIDEKRSLKFENKKIYISLRKQYLCDVNDE